jgi:hypothetical protein
MRDPYLNFLIIFNYQNFNYLYHNKLLIVLYFMSIKDFQLLNKLGEGAYSSVYKVKRLLD